MSSRAAHSSIAPSASAPELRRAKLERLLTKATSSTKGSAPSLGTNPNRKSRKAPGGCPYTGAPPVRESALRTSPVRRLETANVSFSADQAHAIGANAMLESRMRESGMRATRDSSVPALAARLPNQSGNSQGFNTTGTRIATPSTRKAGSYIKSLVGDEKGEGALHWRLVQEMDAIDGFVQENMERQLARESKERQRALLQEQVDQARRQQHDMNASMAKWGGRMKADADAYNQEEMRKKEDQREAMRRHNEDQRRHAQDLERRRREELSADARLEADMAKQAAEAKRRQEDADLRKKRKQQETAKAMHEAAQQAVQNRAQMKQQEALRDIEMMNQQKAMLEAQDRARAAKLQAVKDRMASQMAHYEAGAGNEIAKQAREEQQRADKYQAERQKKEEEAHHDKQKKLKQMQMDGVAWIHSQMAEQAQKKEQEKEDSRKRREAQEKETNLALDKEKEKVAERKRRALENQQFLQRQIEAKAMNKHAGEKMSLVEQSMNKDRLERAKQPENLDLLFQSKHGQYQRNAQINV
eukprot:TRINITY_DN20620_c0_g1_i1.p1 TRINITY_DN20620_c0_g1~~TRINITY_DN20620_c0_g1_i1.p1  ORF type:complete len:530 (+),score=142.44 TRINITY_DN20620_c0_g1_i1:120-1709(+)